MVALHTGSILRNDLVNGFRLYAVDDKIANSGNEMAIGEYIDILLHE